MPGTTGARRSRTPRAPWRYATPPREDYVRGLEEERDLLEQRLRRLEREIDELRRGARPAQEPT
jgi:hypothetical protein